jgi:MraZ protein
MFTGTFEYRIDAKGRLPVPAPFRRALGDDAGPLVVTLLDHCLAVYPASEWAQIEKQLVDLPWLNKSNRAIARRLASQASSCPLDVQGRILIPPIQRRGAGLGNDVVVVGVLNRFEIWSPEGWAAFLQESEALLDDVSQPASTTKP